MESAVTDSIWCTKCKRHTDQFLEVSSMLETPDLIVFVLMATCTKCSRKRKASNTVNVPADAFPSP